VSLRRTPTASREESAYGIRLLTTLGESQFGDLSLARNFLSIPKAKRFAKPGRHPGLSVAILCDFVHLDHLELLSACDP